MSGERNVLWDLVVKCDDICFTHILPRLNRTDVKFLYEVNGETRKLIKRSSRARHLKKKLKVNEMSSISTLEVAWEHYPWGTVGKYGLMPDGSGRMDERSFCSEVARTNKLELLKWAREEKKCKWYVGAICAAAEQGNMEMLKYCVANQCPINDYACALAAKNGELEMLTYLREEVKAPWNYDTAAWAAQNGHLHILEYLVERKYDEFHCACGSAAEYGQLDCLKYLHETAKLPLDDWNDVLEAH